MGKADCGPDKKRTLDEFYQHDNNDIKDLSAFVYIPDVERVISAYSKKNNL